MSQTSGGDKLWRCRNPDCTPNSSIPFETGLTFKVCPFCGTKNPDEDLAPLQRAPLHQDPETATKVAQLVQETPPHQQTYSQEVSAGIAVSTCIGSSSVAASTDCVSTTSLDTLSSTSSGDQGTQDCKVSSLCLIFQFRTIMMFYFQIPIATLYRIVLVCYTVESGYLAHFIIWRTSSIRRMSYYNILVSTQLLHSLSGAHSLIKRKMSGAEY